MKVKMRFILLLTMVGVVMGNKYTDLKKEMLNDYDTHVLPEGKIDVHITVSPIYLHYDYELEILTLVVENRYRWRDQRLSWNPSTHHGINEIAFNYENIWVPDIVTINEVDKSVYVQKHDVFVTTEGHADMVVARKQQVHCTPTDLDMFPWNLQECKYMIGSWSHSKNKLEVFFDDVSLDRFDMTTVDLVDVHGANVQTPDPNDPYPYIEITLKFQRNIYHSKGDFQHVTDFHIGDDPNAVRHKTG